MYSSLVPNETITNNVLSPTTFTNTHNINTIDLSATITELPRNELLQAESASSNHPYQNIATKSKKQREK